MNIRQQVPSKSADFPAVSIVLYGDPKVRKTATAAEFPRPLFLNLEDGCKFITGDIVDIRDAAHLAEVLAELQDDLRAGKLDHRTAVLDGLTTFITAAAHRVHSKDPRQVAKFMAEQFVPILETFYSLPPIRIVTLHSRSGRYEEKVAAGDREKTITVRTEEPDVSPRVATYLTGAADAIGFCHTVQNQPVVDWLPTDTATVKIVAGNRLGLPRQTPLSYEALARLLTSAAPPAGRPSSPTPGATSSGKPAPSAQRPINNNGLATQIKAMKKPSEAVALLAGLRSNNQPTVYWTAVKNFGIDQQLADDVARESGNDWARALRGLDQHVVPF